MDKFGEKQAIKLIKHYTGQDVTPKFIATCDSDIGPNWRGVVVLDNHTLWLVNRLGARGVAVSNPNNFNNSEWNFSICNHLFQYSNRKSSVPEIALPH